MFQHDHQPAISEQGGPLGVAISTPLEAGGGPVVVQGGPYRNVGRASLLAKKNALFDSRT